MKIACVQMDVAYGEPTENVSRITGHLRELKGQGVDLALFPEAAITGYCACTEAEAKRIAVKRDGPEIEALKSEGEKLGIGMVAGFAEMGLAAVHNTAVLLEPGERPRFYRKTHLPLLGMDMYVTPGEELPVWDTRYGRIGILICFDMRYPEAARTLALRGADLVLLPTNWPEGSEISAEHICITRAAESHIFLATCNRVGEENGFRFIGGSKIIDPNGRVLASAADREAVITAEIEPIQAREKLVAVRPGEFEYDVFGWRNPEIYE